jgi:hypothetical protein
MNRSGRDRRASGVCADVRIGSLAENAKERAS